MNGSGDGTQDYYALNIPSSTVEIRIPAQIDAGESPENQQLIVVVAVILTSKDCEIYFPESCNLSEKKACYFTETLQRFVFHSH